jgi:DNA-binding SARP family transcriptional activator
VIATQAVAEDIGLDLTEPPAYVTVVPDLATAIDTAESRIEDPVLELAASREEVPPLLLIIERSESNEDQLAQVLTHDLASALVIGHWESANITIAPDGTVIAQQPPDAGLEQLTRCYIADVTTFKELLVVTDPLPAETEAPHRNDNEGADPGDASEPDPPRAPVEPENIQAGPPPDSEQGTLRLRLVGQPVLTWDGQPIRWRRRKSLQLLTAIALDPDGRTLDDLLETVLGDSHVNKARGHLGTITSDTRRDVKDATGLNIRVVLHDDQTDRYRLHDDVAVDLHEFEQHRRLAAAADNDDDRRAHLETALQLYGGDLASGYEEDWLEQPRAQLQRAAYTTCLHLAALSRDHGDLPAEIATLERATAIDRTRPEAWNALAEAHTAAGDEPAAEKARRHQQLWTRAVHNTAPM